ncbi:MAG: hypothetical protein ACRDRW_14335 [Pseudonocardiaceae bacterium]
MTDHTDAADGHRTAGPEAVTRARPVVLLRYRPGINGRTPRVVHLVPLPPGNQAGTAGVAFCGALLRRDLVEVVRPGQGVLCTLCMINHSNASPPPAPAIAPPAGRISRATDPLTAAACYRAWGWPVIPRGTQVWLDLEPDTVALTIPAPLAARATTILIQWHCPPPALMSHPDAPEHRVVLATERHSMAPPYPRSVHRTTGALPLPPTTTPCGPLTWVRPPQAGALRLCREFEVFAALRTALRDPLA